MKFIKYQALGKTFVSIQKEDGSVEPVEQDLFYDVVRPYSEKMEEVAKGEAYEGIYIIEDDGQPEAPPTDAERIKELEEALMLLLSGVTE